MAQLGYTFDATSVTPAGEWEPIPPGDYTVHIVSSDMKDTKSGTGQFLVLEFQIMDGPCQGRSHHERLNLINPSPQTVEIAQRQFSSICHATGKLTVSDSELLHFIPMAAKFTVHPRKDDPRRLENKVSFKPLEGRQKAAQRQVARPQASAQPAQAAPQASGAKQPPWRKSA